MLVNVATVVREIIEPVDEDDTRVGSRQDRT